MDLLQVVGFFSLLILTSSQTTTTSWYYMDHTSSDDWAPVDHTDDDWTPTDSPAAQPSYLLLAPTALCPGVPTSVSVTILTDSTVTVSAHILHADQTVASNSATVTGGSTERLILPAVEESESSDRQPYVLQVKGHVGGVEVFSNSTQLNFKLKGPKTFIQTDKQTYKPGQHVKIRVVSIHPDGKPDVSPVDIIIKDPKGNLLRQWLALDTRLGVVTKEFKLSKNPPLGKWTICAKVGSVSSEKRITVAYYVLPRFEVGIEVPDIIYREDPLHGRVTAMYMHNKPVYGYVDVKILFYHQGYANTHHDFLEINGTEDFRFDFPDYYFHEMSKRSADMYDYNYDYMNEEVTVMVNVTEYLTGLTYNSTAKVMVANSRYNISFEDYSEILKPSLNFTATLKICTYNNQPLSMTDQYKMLTVTVKQKRNSEEIMPLRQKATASPETSTLSPGDDREEMFHIPADGLIPLNFPLNDDTEELIIEAHLEDSYKRLDLFRQYTSPSHSYVQIRKPSGPCEVGVPVMLQIERNFPMTEIHYVVKSRGQVVSAGRSSGGLTLVPESSWAPLACVVVYCVHPNGEIVNDFMELPIAHTLPNKVSLRWSGTVRKPAEEVTLRVDVAEPGSVVWILVVDKATKGNGSNNDITKEMVLKEMMKNDEADSDEMMVFMGDPYSVFKACDLVALTDANLHVMRNPWNQLLEEMLVFDMAGGSQMEQKPEPRERWFFPETWIWMDTVTGNSTSAQIPLTVPDSITTWVASAFVMSENLGLGLVDHSAQLTVSQDFFLSLNVPACIIRGEELLLEVLLFNYLPQDLQVTVTVAESEAFQFVFSGYFKKPSRQVLVESQRGASVHFPILPMLLGEIHFSVMAESAAASDHVRRTVLVKAEGLEKLSSSSILFELSSPSDSFITKEISFTFPPDVVPGSERASVTAVGDIIGPSIGGLDALIQMPYGCGEQNMINFAPNIYVLQYLTAAGQADQQTTATATEYMTSGYERELTYQRGDGSFSAFGEQDASGSTWLSAFVLRCFLQARPFISIDPGVLHGAAAWLGAQQGADGRFLEVGRVIHTELQGGLDGPASLTAFVLIGLLEDSQVQAQYASQASAAQLFLESRLTDGVSSNYSLSLICYALALSGSASADSAISNLIGRAQIRDGVPMWSSPDVSLSESWQPSSSCIEMASYLLLALHERGRAADGLGLMKWLSQQRNHRGGFGSTQDTIVALQALSAYASLMGSHGYDLNIRVKSVAAATVAHFYINQDNYLLHQSQQIHPEEVMKLTVTAEGQGLALFQLNVFYNVRKEAMQMQMMKKKKRKRRRRFIMEDSAFLLFVDLHDFDLNLVDLYICYSLSDFLQLNQTGMAIMEAGLLSGFNLAPEGVPTNHIIKKVETPPGKVVLYLDSVTTEQMCVRVPMILEYKVGKLQEAHVVLYDYYEPRRRTEVTYMAEWRNALSSCSLFQDDWTKCNPDDYPSVDYSSSTANYSSSHHYSSSDDYPSHHYSSSDDYFGLSVFSHGNKNVLMASLSPTGLLLFSFIVLLFGI
ncbi:CD109 antigen [Centropristis striata]|uniref:CD109 antigen n=1 Tax=Centropristis striata TaxID=184440 RepID=UPI0027E01127|nr:CD109 antigen [Centropristis striata]